MKLPSPLEMQLLALIADDERSGREVAQMYKAETGEAIGYGSLYTCFRRMVEAGWVKVRDDLDEDGRVRYFKIDVNGRRALQNGRAFYAGISTFGLPEGRTA
jgi:DNA-binding PadR family transcriptional regulator